MSDPVAEFNSLVASSEFLFVVYYRGHWCPFCRTYIATLESLAPRITSAGGKTLIVTSEPVEHLAEVRTKTGYSGSAINDTENVLAAELKKRGLLDLVIDKKSGYVNGMAQPGVLVIRKDESLYSWAIVPAFMNLYGAKDRPSLTEVWDNVEAKMGGKPMVHEKYSVLKFSQGISTLIKG